jgi:putative copper export protein
MEHSLLHAIALWGLILVTGGPLLVLGLLEPAMKSAGRPLPEGPYFARAMRQSAARWVVCGAAVTALATLLDLFVQVAEGRGQTVFVGMPLSEVFRFATRTHVGQFSLARAGVLLVIAAIAWRHSSSRRGSWWAIGVLAVTAIILTALVSHAAAQPTGRRTAILVQIVHLGAVSLWLGVLFHLLALRGQIQRATDRYNLAVLAKIVRRFSPVALVAVSSLLLSGVIAACRFVGGPDALFTSAYGLTLLVKLTLLIPAFFAGLVNHWIIRPGLLSLRDSHNEIPKGPILQRFGRMLELEVTAGLLVLAVAGILASVSPPGGNQSLKLTAPQQRALTSPRVPAMDIPNPAGFYGAPTRTLADLHYAEFTHHCSGLMVCLLGLCWLAQGAGGRTGHWSGRIWPWLLVPFAAFIAVASDPEIWWLRRVSLWRTLGDPQLFEHQLGAGIILLLAWLGWRDGRRPDFWRPLGYTLPVIMMLGRACAASSRNRPPAGFGPRWCSASACS